MEAIKSSLDAAVAPLIETFGIGIDIGLTTTRILARSRCLVMWYDFRFGHKTVLGDRAYVRGLEQFSHEGIDPLDVRNLLVNRGTLLVINRLLLEQPVLSSQQQRTIVKHAVKAIIGYGDALLFSEGAYHWSYAEKQRRMQSSSVASQEFRALYDEAMNFRFSPDYDRYLRRDLRAWNAELLGRLADIHLSFEGRRLGGELHGWGGYLERALRRQLKEGLPQLRAAATKVVGLRANRAQLGPMEPLARLGFRCSRPSEYLPLLFPVVAYDLADTDFRHAAREILGVGGDAQSLLIRGYLRAWGEHGDGNFIHVLRRLGVDLNPPRRQDPVALTMRVHA